MDKIHEKAVRMSQKAFFFYGIESSEKDIQRRFEKLLQKRDNKTRTN